MVDITDRINASWQEFKRTKVGETLTRERDSDFIDNFLAGVYKGVVGVMPLWLKPTQRLLERIDYLDESPSISGMMCGDLAGAMIWLCGMPAVAFNVVSTGAVLTYERVRDHYQGSR